MILRRQFGRITVRGNLVKDGPGRLYGFGPSAPSVLRLFAPARVTRISATDVGGAAGADSPCPNCIVDVYVDDIDNAQEALTFVGSATADASGNWTLPFAGLAAGTGLRTMSTPQNAGVIGGLGAGTTTRTSILYVPLSTPVISGAITSTAGLTQTYQIAVSPQTIQTPVTYTIEATGYTTSVQLLQSTSMLIPVNWATPGTKTLKITATNDLSEVNATITVEVTGGSTGPNKTLWLPLTTQGR